MNVVAGTYSKLPADQESDQRRDVGAEDQASPTSVYPISSKILPIRHQLDQDPSLTSGYISHCEASARFLRDDLMVNTDGWKGNEVDYPSTTETPGHTVSKPLDKVNATKKIKLSVVAADNLIKEHVFRFPDTFVVVTIDGGQARATSVVKKSCNPYWNESFELSGTADSVLNVEVYDQKDTKPNTKRGLLGYLELRLGRAIGISSVADGMLRSILSLISMFP